MRSAPPLRIFISEDRSWTRWQRWLPRAGAVLLGFWLVLQAFHHTTSGQTPSLAVWLAAAFGLCAVALSFKSPPANRGELCWNGTVWLFTPASVSSGVPARVLSGRLRVRIDLGRWMLLSLHPISPTPLGATIWLATAQDSLAPRDWHTLRCAVYSPRPEPSVIHDR